MGFSQDEVPRHPRPVVLGTSPVEDISTPSRGSEFFRRPKENMGTLQALVTHGWMDGWKDGWMDGWGSALAMKPKELG